MIDPAITIIMVTIIMIMGTSMITVAVTSTRPRASGGRLRSAFR